MAKKVLAWQGMLKTMFILIISSQSIVTLSINSIIIRTYSLAIQQYPEELPQLSFFVSNVVIFCSIAIQ